MWYSKNPKFVIANGIRTNNKNGSWSFILEHEYSLKIVNSS